MIETKRGGRLGFESKDESLKVNYPLIAHSLAKFNAFSHFDIPTMCKLLLIANYKMFKKGDFICNHEDLADLMVIVVSGAASI